MDAYAVQIIRDNKWIILGTLLSGLLLVKRYYNTVYAKVLYLINLKLSKSKTLMGAKAKLFSQIPAPQDKGMTNSEDLLIVEIGAGTGANFTFFPDGSVVKCVEPKTEFESYVTDERKKNGEHLKSVEFVQGYGESLSKNFEPSSVDFVVTTLVLCSVQDVEKVAQEARKILKPGGKYLFFEHVNASENHTWQRIYKTCITPFGKLFTDNCHWNREPWIQIRSAGFTSIEYERKRVSSVSIFGPMSWICVGTATK